MQKIAILPAGPILTDKSMAPFMLGMPGLKPAVLW
jgi:hypothetical protein